MTQSAVAAIDCGTNSIRLLISGQGREFAREMRIVRLGQGVDQTGRLDPAAIERTRVALASYRELIDRFGVRRIRMVATSATRDASNASDFHDMVLATLGQPAEVISGDEEAALSFAGAVAGLYAPGGASTASAIRADVRDAPLGERDYIVVDIGGGSTEFVRGRGGVVRKAISTDIGCVRMTERHLHSDPPAADELAAARADIAEAVRKGLSHVGDGPATLVGLAGSVTTVSAIAMGLKEYDPQRIHHSVLTAADIDRVARLLSELDHEQRAAIEVIHPGRVDVIVAGSLILQEIMTISGYPEMIVSEHDILDGIAASISQLHAA